jgi:hypothetical protein
MSDRQVCTALVFPLLLATAGPVVAGAPDLPRRRQGLLHVCVGGAKAGQQCKGDAQSFSCDALTPCDPGSVCDLANQTCNPDCPGGKCELAFSSKPFDATLTAIMDDFVTDPTNDSQFVGRALTAVLEVKDGNRRKLIAETYQAPDILVGIWNNGVDESSLLAEPLDGFFLQNLSQREATLAEALRAFFGETGVPVVVAAGRKEETTDGRGNAACTAPQRPDSCCTGPATGDCERNASCTAAGAPRPCCVGPGLGTCDIGDLASVVRLRLKIRFVPAVP